MGLEIRTARLLQGLEKTLEQGGMGHKNPLRRWVVPWTHARQTVESRDAAPLRSPVPLSTVMHEAPSRHSSTSRYCLAYQSPGGDAIHGQDSQGARSTAFCGPGDFAARYNGRKREILQKNQALNVSYAIDCLYQSHGQKGSTNMGAL